jgi:murein DD-endopeptidase MepM/ murein hydrolase activator NlpD
MDVFTLIVVPEGHGAVRRFRVRRRAVKTLAGALALGIAALGITTFVVAARLGSTDDAQRAFLDAEVARLAAEVAAHEAGARSYAERAAGIEVELDRLREFERRVRVIANLPRGHGGAEPLDPAARPDGEAPDPSLSLSGVGGGAERPEDATPPLGTPLGAVPEPTPDRDAAAERTAAPATSAPPPVSAPAPSASLGTDGAAPWGPLGALARRIEQRMRHRGAGLQQLVDALRGKAEQLAATPSILPTRGWITSRFGWRISPFTGRRDFHEGLDVAAEFGTSIVAAARGRVVFAGGKGALGRSVVIEHAGHVRTTYGHARELLVKPGQRVERGDPIATVGSTGRSTGPHLHYAVELNGDWVNPLDYVVD